MHSHQRPPLKTPDAPELARLSGLSGEVIEGFKAVFGRYPAIEKAVLYGSRAQGNWRNESDIDLVLHGEGIDWRQFLRINQAVDDLLLPWKVDLSLYHQIDNPALKDHITRAGVVFYPYP